jgi:pimeloyl-ACP methyl ester carboxylesterase
VAQIALIGSTVPRLEVDAGAAAALLEQLRVGYGQWIADNAEASFGGKPPATEIPQVEKEQAIRDWMSVSLQAAISCQQATFETDFADELSTVRVPALVIHGDDDAVAPLEICGRRSAGLLPDARLVIYRNGSHMVHLSHRAQLNGDLLRFLDEG